MDGGALSGGIHRMPLRVYYEDTDFSGFVYHASYLRFMERGRTELLRVLAGDQSRMQREADCLVFMVRRMQLDFLKPARMDDRLDVRTWSRALRGATMDLRQEVRRADDILVRAEVIVACVREGRAIRLPDGLRAALSRSVPAEG